MCQCTPGIKTPFCGAPGCQWPAQTKVTAQPTVTLIEAFRQLYSAASAVESGLHRECDHATYEGGTSEVDDLREILQSIEDEFPTVLFGGHEWTDEDA
jgi:hypothetical protein